MIFPIIYSNQVNISTLPWNSLVKFCYAEETENICGLHDALHIMCERQDYEILLIFPDTPSWIVTDCF